MKNITKINMGQLEDVFTQLQKEVSHNNDPSRTLATLTRVVKKIFDLDVVVDIIPVTSNHQFFGMNIVPNDDETISVMSSRLVTQHNLNIRSFYEDWDKIKKWSIEIDEALLVSNSLAATPQEITAIFLHEIGHTVYSNTVPYRIMKSVRTAIQGMNIRLRKILTWKPARNILNIIFYQAVQSKSFHDPMKEETEADKFVVRMGYGKHLQYFLDKLIEYEGNRIIDLSDGQLLQDVDIFVKWYVSSLSDLQYRSQQINKDLATMIKHTTSTKLGKVLVGVRELFTDHDNRKFSYNDLLRGPQSQLELEEALESATPKQLYRRLKTITLSDIDMISIRIPKIETGSDQMYVLDLIHYYINILKDAKSVLEDTEYGPKVKYPLRLTEIDEYLVILNNLRKTTLSVKITPKNYKILIDYPKGYEG